MSDTPQAGAAAGDDVLVLDACATAVRTRRFLDALDTATGHLIAWLGHPTHTSV